MAHLSKTHVSSCARPSFHSAELLQRLLRISSHVLVAILLCLGLQPCLRADTISGTVKDPSGAVVAGARIEITGGNLSQPLLLTSDESGKFVAPNLPPAKYSVHVVKEGFGESATTIDLHGAADLNVQLTIAQQQTSVNVTEKSLAFANSDSAYRQLRDIGLGLTYRCGTSN